MQRGFLLGRLFGTDIYATGGFFLLLALYFLLGRDAGDAAVWCLVVVVSILVHEFGHVFAVRRFAGGPCWVQLWMLGGLCHHERIRHRGKQVAVSLFGPVFGFVLGGLGWLALRYGPALPPMGVGILALVLWVNIVWNGLNLLPIWPLDGGQALRAALATALGGPRAARVVRRVSIATAAGAGLIALRYGFRFGAALAILLAMENILGRGPAPD